MDLVASQESLVIVDIQGSRVFQDTLVSLASQDLVAFQDFLVLAAAVVIRVSQEVRDILVTLVFPDSVV